MLLIVIATETLGLNPEKFAIEILSAISTPLILIASAVIVPQILILVSQSPYILPPTLKSLLIVVWPAIVVFPDIFVLPNIVVLPATLIPVVISGLKPGKLAILIF